MDAQKQPPTLSHASRLQTRERRGLLMAAIAVLAVAAALKLPMEVSHIFWNPHAGAKDLRYYFDWAHDWADGRNVYLRDDRPEYPPGSLPVLYAISGWLDWPQARLLMGALSLCGAAVLVAIAWRATVPRGAGQALLLVLLLASNNGTGTALGNGQLALIVIPLSLAAVLILHRRAVAWRTDLAAAACLATALVKPSLAVPFVWLALVFPQGFRWRPMLLTAAGYAMLSALALWVMDASVTELLLAAVRHGVGVATTARDPNLHFVLGKLGLPSLMLPATALALLGLGTWIYRNRRADLWILLGVTALVARMWTYHRVYDDVLILLPQIALWRIAAARADDRAGDVAAALLAFNALAVVAPGNLTDPPQWLQRTVFVAQGLVWPITLAALVRYARPDHGVYVLPPRRRRSSAARATAT